MGAESITKTQLLDMLKVEVGPIVAEFVKEQQAKTADQNKGFMAQLLSAQAEKPAEKPTLGKGMMFSRLLGALAMGKGRVGDAIDAVKKFWGKEDPVLKALTVADSTAGGTLVPEVWSADFIEFYRPKAVVRSLAPMVLPMPAGNLTIPKVTGGSTSYYAGENQNATNSQQTTGVLKLSNKKLITLTAISNDLLRQSADAAMTMTRNDSGRSMAAREDLAFIRGNGVSDTPKGLLYLMPQTAAAQIAANATSNLANTIVDLGKAMVRLTGLNVPMTAPAWIMSSRSENWLRTLLTANGQFVFKDEMSRGTVFGISYRMTTQIPETLGGGTDSEVYLADFGDVMIGDTLKMIVDVSTEAAYYDAATATVVSSFSKDLSVMRIISEHDFGLRHDEAACMLNAVKWGT
jgi:HK97 family phage major capsid protein